MKLTKSLILSDFNVKVRYGVVEIVVEKYGFEIKMRGYVHTILLGAEFYQEYIL